MRCAPVGPLDYLPFDFYLELEEGFAFFMEKL